MFSKYETYSTTTSMYCYDDSNILINKLGIKTLKELKEAEEEITSVKQYEMLLNPIKGNFSKTHIINIHKFLFEDLYPFAGKFRKESIGKANTWFYPPNMIQEKLSEIFAFLKGKNNLKGLDENSLFDMLAYVMAEINIIHPFREGNGRCIREFIRILALKNGYELNWGNIDKETLLETSILSVDDYKVLIPVLKQCVEND